MLDRGSMGRGCLSRLFMAALVVSFVAPCLAMTPVDGRQLGGVGDNEPRAVSVTAPLSLSGVGGEATTQWSEGCLRDPAAAERLRRLHLGTVRPLALAMTLPVQDNGAPEWVVCR